MTSTTQPHLEYNISNAVEIAIADKLGSGGSLGKLAGIRIAIESLADSVQSYHRHSLNLVRTSDIADTDDSELYEYIAEVKHELVTQAINHARAWVDLLRSRDVRYSD